MPTTNAEAAASGVMTAAAPPGRATTGEEPESCFVPLGEPGGVDRVLHTRACSAPVDHAFDFLVGSVQGEWRGADHSHASFLGPSLLSARRSSLVDDHWTTTDRSYSRAAMPLFGRISGVRALTRAAASSWRDLVGGARCAVPVACARGSVMLCGRREGLRWRALGEGFDQSPALKLGGGRADVLPAFGGKALH